MQSMLLTDYILGNSFSKRFKDSFIEQAPSFIHSLPEIEFILDGQGNYKFKEKNDFYAPFIQWSYSNQSIGNFFIIFKRYMEQPINLIQSKPLKENNFKFYDFQENLTAYIKPNQLYDSEGELIEAAFASIIPKTQELIFVYFYKNGNKVGHLRNNLTNVKMGLHLRKEDKALLQLLKTYDNNKNNLEIQQDNIKEKYLGRFTEQPYIVI